jgi:hypothetical protein
MKPAMEADDEDKTTFFDAFDLDSTVTNAKSDAGLSIASLFNSFFGDKENAESEKTHPHDERGK